MKKNYTQASRRRDRLAELLIRICGLFVIVAVVWILVMITRVALPLFYSPKATSIASISLRVELKQSRLLSIGIDETQQELFALDGKGLVHFIDTRGGTLKESVPVPDPPPGARTVVSAELVSKSLYNLLWDTGAVSSVKIAFSSTRSESGNTIVSHEVSADPEGFFPGSGAFTRSFVRTIEGKGAVRVDQLESDRIRVTWRSKETDLFGNEKATTSSAEIQDPLPAAITAVVLDHAGHYLYAGTRNGQLMRWDISEPGEIRLLDSTAVTGNSPVTALNLVLGDISVAVGDGKGGYTAWFPVTAAGSGEGKQLVRTHVLRPHTGTVSAILPSPRDKSLVSVNDQGVIHIDHVTSERNLLTLKGAKPVAMLALSAQGNSLCSLDTAGSFAVWRLEIPHPEVSLGTLFGKVWYEGYDRPEYVWQSSAANDDFEPKMSLVPLIFGTLKATAFAMLFAVPLALLGALYTSQFMAPRLKNRIKPAVEIMAAIPSVVVGFLAGLWLAPLIDKVVLAFFLSFIIIPVMLLVTIFFWRLIKTASPLERCLRGKEFIVLIPIVLVGTWLAYLLGGIVEVQVFGGDFKQWLYSVLGIRYDQRNSMIIAVALGFAVIPLIFTIAEDALSNVPRNLTAASLALGASRWQTAWRVVLPSALPGVFSAVMIGFGRAVGETMIVLMATGNTPIMSGSIFNGLRSLSANIAVEIPEASLNGSLYRVLFLSAVLLFIFTFIINTVAEALRQRFRRKYGRY